MNEHYSDTYEPTSSEAFFPKPQPGQEPTFRPLSEYVEQHTDSHAQYDTAADLTPPELDEPLEYLETGDWVEAWLPGAREAKEGEIVSVNVETQWAIVEFRYGARRSVHVDDMRLIIKGVALSATDKAALSA